MSVGSFETNFFRAKSPFAKANRRLTITLLVIWLLAVYGFQVLLMVAGEPTPEKTYNKALITKVFTDAAVSVEEKQDFARILFFVFGKNNVVTPADKAVIKESLSQTVFGLLAPDKKSVLNAAVASGSEQEKEIVAALGLKPDEITTSPEGRQEYSYDRLFVAMIPYAVVPVTTGEISEISKKALTAIFDKYLVHNQSFLTDTTFIGFPLHYWYTAQFLLIMFVLMCLIYAKWNDRANKKFNIAEDE